MQKTTFLRSTLRQPVRTAFLLLLVVTLSFAFTLKTGEALMINSEAERIGTYYHCVGEVAWEGETEPDVSAATVVLQNSPYVKTVNLESEASGVMQGGLYNVYFPYGGPSDLEGELGSESPWDVFFYGEYLYGGREHQDYGFVFKVDEVLGAYPEYLSEGKEVVLYGTNRGDMLYELEVGKRYLLRGHYNVLTERNYRSEYSYIEGRKPVLQPYDIFEIKTLTNTLPAYIEAEENIDLGVPEYAELAHEIQSSEENRRALKVQAYVDVSTARVALESERTIYLMEGRFPDFEDNDEGRHVCAIHRDLAASRGLSCGDEITLRIRDSMGASGLYGQNDMAYSAVGAQNESFEIIGVFGETREQSLYFNTVYIPLSTLQSNLSVQPELVRYYYRQILGTANINSVTIIEDNSAQEARAGTFVLISPEMEAEFLADVSNALGELGFNVVFFENGWEAFHGATESMRSTAQFGAMLFGGLFALALCLVSFLYYRFRRRELAISRALGVSIKQCVSGVLVPLLGLGGIGILIGGGLAYFYLGMHSEQMLSGLAEFGEVEASGGLDISRLLLLMLVQFMLMATVSGVFVLPVTKCSVLMMMQGAEMRKAVVSKIQDPKIQGLSVGMRENRTNDTAVIARTEAPRPAKYAPMLRFVRRSLLRAPGRSLLIMLMAAAFMLGLMFVYTSALRAETRLDELFDTITVELDLTRANGTLMSDEGRGFVPQRMVDAVLNSGYVTDSYLEAELLTDDVREIDPDTGYMVQPTSDDEQGLQMRVQITNDIGRFLDDPLNAAYPISWLDGGDEEHFNNTATTIPAVLPLWLYEDYKVSESGEIAVILPKKQGMIVGRLTAIGIWEGSSILAPQSEMLALLDGEFSYYKASFVVDTAMNRQLDEFRIELSEITADIRVGEQPLTAVLWDEELRQAVQPLERMVKLLQILYPVVVVLSAVSAMAVIVLANMALVRDAAIFRVVGNSRKRSCEMLLLQTVSPALFGVLTGIGSSLAFTRDMSIVRNAAMFSALWHAGLYLAATVLAAIASTIIMTAKNPLELLQVKE